ncbi:MAG: endonuclease III, partial [bacterium]|nr:endonuclease III [bacterium]
MNRISMTKKRSQKIIEKLIHKYGNIDTELSSNNIYELSIAVILSAQTTDRQVNSVTPDLFKRYPNFQRLSKAAISDVEDIIRSVGLYKTKARNIVKLSQEVMNVYNGILPNSREELMKLPGIGRKSANVILAIGFK